MDLEIAKWTSFSYERFIERLHFCPVSKDFYSQADFVKRIT